MAGQEYRQRAGLRDIRAAFQLVSSSRSCGRTRAVGKWGPARQMDGVGVEQTLSTAAG